MSTQVTRTDHRTASLRLNDNGVIFTEERILNCPCQKQAFIFHCQMEQVDESVSKDF